MVHLLMLSLMLNIHDNTTQDCFTGQGSQGAGFYDNASNVEYNGGYIYSKQSLLMLEVLFL